MSAGLITATYTVGDDCRFVVSTVGGAAMGGSAADIVTARERAEELVAQLGPAEPSVRTVMVHLLDGCAVAFTRAYLTARFNLDGQRSVEVSEEDRRSAKELPRQRVGQGDTYATTATEKRGSPTAAATVSQAAT